MTALKGSIKNCTKSITCHIERERRISLVYFQEGQGRPSIHVIQSKNIEAALIYWELLSEMNGTYIIATADVC